MKHLLLSMIVANGAVCAAAAQDTPAAGEGAEPQRTWIDSTGRFQTQATLVSRDADTVTLRRADGPTVHVPIARLSQRDRQYLEQRSEPLPADLIYVYISDRTLRRFWSRPVAQQTAVHDTIVGRPVRGAAATNGTVNLRLVPAADRAVVELVLHGTVQSQTTSFGGPVQVHSSGVTRFAGVKRMSVDEQGVLLYPARVAARTSTGIQGISTDLPFLRGWIARRVGSRRAAEMKPAAEHESARKAEARIAAQFDRDVMRQWLAASGDFSRMLDALAIDADVPRDHLRFSSSGDYFQVAVFRAGAAPSQVRPPSPAALGSPEIAVHVHRGLVERVVRNTQLQQQLEQLANELLAGEAQRLVGIVPAQQRVEVKQSADGEWWSLVVRELRPAGL